jgi:hypothetical protein
MFPAASSPAVEEPMTQASGKHSDILWLNAGGSYFAEPKKITTRGFWLPHCSFRSATASDIAFVEYAVLTGI